MDRRASPLAMGPADIDPAVRGGAWLLSATGLHHRDDGADHPVAAQGRRLRSDLVRCHHDHRHGDGAHSPAGWAEPLRDQEYRPGYPVARCDLGRDAVRRADDRGRGDDVLVPWHRNLVPRCADGLEDALIIFSVSTEWSPLLPR